MRSGARSSLFGGARIIPSSEPDEMTIPNALWDVRCTLVTVSSKLRYAQRTRIFCRAPSDSLDAIPVSPASTSLIEMIASPCQDSTSSANIFYFDPVFDCMTRIWRMSKSKTVVDLVFRFGILHCWKEWKPNCVGGNPCGVAWKNAPRRVLNAFSYWEAALKNAY